MMRMLLNFTLSHEHVRGPVSYKIWAEVMDHWILDTNPWIIKAESHQHAPVYREIPSLDQNPISTHLDFFRCPCWFRNSFGANILWDCETRITESPAHWIIRSLERWFSVSKFAFDLDDFGFPILRYAKLAAKFQVAFCQPYSLRWWSSINFSRMERLLCKCFWTVVQCALFHCLPNFIVVNPKLNHPQNHDRWGLQRIPRRYANYN